MLVLDQQMPGLTGADLLRAIRTIPMFADTSAIFYTADEEGQAEACRLAPRLGAAAELIEEPQPAALPAQLRDHRWPTGCLNASRGAS
jgi:CheY-like chemotaxis protein